MSKTFADLGLSDEALLAIKSKGFEIPTEIQEQAIPLLLNSTKDVIAQAQTGTGKTATFGLVFTDRLVAGKFKTPQAIVLAPTRELAIQISEELNSLKGNKKLSIVPIYGGQSWTLQQRHLRQGVDIVVGTPGRVIDHLERGTLKLDNAHYFVLDEADEMLNMGFIEDIEKILSHTKPERQVLLFSATMPRQISNLAKKYMRDTEHIKMQEGQIAKNSIDQIYFEVERQNKFEALCRIIDMEEAFYGIVFCRTKVESDEVSKHLNDRGYRAEAFHGDISQDRREKILKNFRAKRTDALIATDVAARGIDVSDLTHVINYALPQNSESYVHRIGRTGRAGKDGKAITLITPREYRQLRSFEARAKADIKGESLPDGATMVDIKKRKILQDIGMIVEDEGELYQYQELAKGMFGTEDPEMIIAALLKLHYADTLNQHSYRNLESRRRGDRNEKGAKKERSRYTDEIGTTRLFLTMGRKDGATPPKILQTIEKEFGVSGRVVGAIDIMSDFSFITVPLAEAEQIMDAFHNLKKVSRPSVRVERAQKGKKTGGRPSVRPNNRDKGARGNFSKSGGSSDGRSKKKSFSSDKPFNRKGRK